MFRSTRLQNLKIIFLISTRVHLRIPDLNVMLKYTVIMCRGGLAEFNLPQLKILIQCVYVGGGGGAIF